MKENVDKINVNDKETGSLKSVTSQREKEKGTKTERKTDANKEQQT